MATGYQIIVHERRADPDDWTCQCNMDSDYVYENKVYLSREEADAECSRLQKEVPYSNHGGFDNGDLIYKVQEVHIN